MSRSLFVLTNAVRWRGSSSSLTGALLSHRGFSPCVLVPVFSPSPFLPSLSTLSVKASRHLESPPLSLSASPGLSRGLQASKPSHRLQALAHRHRFYLQFEVSKGDCLSLFIWQVHEGTSLTIQMNDKKQTFDEKFEEVFSLTEKGILKMVLQQLNLGMIDEDVVALVQAHRSSPPDASSRPDNTLNPCSSESTHLPQQE
ncbi:hypothetical protein PIB30_070668 [Stylosanthes scabra]|uniref:Uncharacterized protein n=1 Tax=Stylosanthes scabra TaxID=79078 RepID=A0ABU6VMJ9_9FABA|nr:hypothetical protein [Stylosanthes scabra]